MWPSEFNIEVDDPYTYSLDNASTKYYVTAYPDTIDGGQYVTQIVTYDPDCDVFGFHVGDSSDRNSIDTHMATFGYQSDSELSYNNGKVRVRFSLDQGTIIGMAIIIEIENRDGIQF